jgi:DNA-binding NarL/FixJ family response regulator
LVRSEATAFPFRADEWDSEMQVLTPETTPHHLPRPLRSTLSCLLEGTSENEAAACVGISRHTVHGYITALYRHFRVKSQVELLVLCLRRERRNL